MAPTIITRADYLIGHATHQEYYAQFVTDATRRHVTLCFTAEELAAAYAENKHLNSIKLEHWDRLAWVPVDPKNRYRPGHSGPFRSTVYFDREAIKAAGEQVTRSILVCIVKEAARQIAEQHEATNAE